MKVRTVLIAGLFIGSGVVGCREEPTHWRQDSQRATEREAKNAATAQAGPRQPSVVGVDTTRIDFDGKLAGVRVAILATNGFEQSELVDTRQAFADHGASTVIVSPEAGDIQGYRHDALGDRVRVDLTMQEADPQQFDALVLPGGVINGDRMRVDPDVTAFVKAFGNAQKPIAAICHGLWPMVEAGVVRGRTLTSWPSLKTDLKNAGAKWVDQEVVVDRNIVTSRNPDDIPAFNAQAIALFAKSRPAIGGGPISDDE